MGPTTAKKNLKLMEASPTCDFTNRKAHRIVGFGEILLSHGKFCCRVIFFAL